MKLLKFEVGSNIDNFFHLVSSSHIVVVVVVWREAYKKIQESQFIESLYSSSGITYIYTTHKRPAYILLLLARPH